MDGFVIQEHAQQQRTSCLIVGHRCLQNDLLANLVCKRLDTRCTVAPIDETLRMRGTKRTVALIDHDSIDASTIETHFPALGERAEVIALFNACDTNSYAWMLGQPKVRGLFYRDTSESQFLRGLRALLNNECWLPRKLLADHLERTRNFGQNNADLVTCLTDKELAILRCLASGASNAEIAKQLYNSPHTVKTHLHHLFRKLKVNNRVQAVSWLHQHPGALEEAEP